MDDSFKLSTLFPSLFGHVLQPADYGYAVACTITVVYKSLAHILSRIIGHSGCGDRTTNDAFLLVDSDGALTLLYLSYLDGWTIGKGNGVSIFMVCQRGNIPHLIIIYNMIGSKAYQPIACGVVTPIGVDDAVWNLACYMDVRERQA